jgi:hypothetical protein
MMTEISSNEPFFSADFGDHGGRFEWQTYAEAQAWLNELQNSWSWLSNGWGPNNNAWNTIVSGISNSLNLLGRAESARNQGQESTLQSSRDEAKRVLESFVKTHPWVLPASPRRHFAFDIKDRGRPNEAGILVAHWIGHDLSGPPIRSIVWALVQDELFDRGIKDRLDTEAVALNKLSNQLQTRLTELKETERIQVRQFEQSHAAATEQVSKQAQQFSFDQNERNDAWQRQRADAQNELKKVQDTYDDYMSLAAPVKYWEAKQKKHRNLMWGSGVVLVVAMFTSGYFLHSEIESIGKTASLKRAAVTVEAKNLVSPSNWENKISTSAPSTAPSAIPSPISEVIEVAASWKLGSFLLLATICFWLLRLLVRVFLSNMHLENDASERVTMAKTYLALLRKGRLPEKADISVVLAALFRPSGDGIVKDEGVPPTTLEWFTKLGGR